MSFLRQMQLFGAAWRFDWGSMLIGLLLGALLALLILRVWPTFRRWQRNISGRLRQSLAWMQSGVEIRFQAETAEYVQRHHLGRDWATLDQIVAPPRLLIPPQEIDIKSASDWGASQLHFLWPDLAAGVATPIPPTIGLHELLVGGRRTVVSAGAGAGKTTLLANCAYQCATATTEGRYAGLHPVIPVFVHLAELKLPAVDKQEAETEPEAQDPVAPLSSALRRRYGPLTGTGINGMLRDKLKNGQLLLLLDGWDELPPDKRPAVTDWLRRLLDSFPDIQVIVAAPMTGYGPFLELDFTVTGLMPWCAGQVEAFAEDWTKAFPLSHSPQQRYFWRPGQSALENSLRFWLLAAYQEVGGPESERPKRWSDLLHSSLSLFNGGSETKADIESGNGLPPPDRITLAFWLRLAGALVVEGKVSLTQSEVGGHISAILAEHGIAEERGVAGQLQKTLAQSSLFVTWSNDTIGFMCVAWRDYLAAAHLAQQGSRETVAAHLTDPYWSDILRNFVGLVGATEMATAMLSSEVEGLTRDALFQVASWMANATDGGKWRRQTMIGLAQIIRQDMFTNVLRQRAAAALSQTAEPGILAFVTQLLERSDPFSRQLAAIALSHLGTEEAVDFLWGMLEDDDDQVRQAAVRALAWLPHKVAEHSLIVALIQGDDEMRRIAAEGLAKNGREGIEILKEAVEDEDVRVRRAAVLALALLDEPWLDPLLAQIERKDGQWLVRSAATAAQEIIEARRNPPPWQPLPLSEQNWFVRYAATDGRIVPEGATTKPLLVQLLAESASSPKLRAAAAIGLGQIAAHDALPALESAVNDPDNQVREAAFVSLCLLRRAYAGTAKR